MDNGRITELERTVWAMADTMRGHHKQNQYGRYILPLMVLRRLDCALEPHREAIQEAVSSVPDGVDQATRDEHILDAADGLWFYNTSKTSLTGIHAGEPEHLRDGLIEWVSAFSHDIRDVLLNRFKLPEKLQDLADKDILFSLVSSVVALDLRVRDDDDPAAPGASNAEMGTLFEHLIRRFSEAENSEAGEHFTPPDVVRLIADLLVSADTSLLTKRGIVRDIYDPTCGTGRMLTVGEERIRALAPQAVINLYGQELNEESYGICKADMLMKGHDPSFIRQGNTLIRDRHDGQRFHYMMANPPFGGSWKKESAEVEREARRQGSRFSAGLPRRTDGQMLFLLHMLSKMRPEGSRIGIVMNGSPLFAGSAGQGENRIRRWVLENDWLEAVIGLPEQMFYNTGISTYVWVLANRKPPERAGLVQLIDATGPRFWAQMPKGLGDKRRYLPGKSTDSVVDLYAHLGKEGPLQEFSKLLPTAAFGYRRVAINIPTFDGSPGCLARIRAGLLAQGWDEGQADDAVDILGAFPPSARRDLEGFEAALRMAEREASFSRKLTAKERKGLLSVVQEGDTEQVPLLDTVEGYMAREVHPFAPGSKVDTSVVDEKDGSAGLVGYEVPFTPMFSRSRTHRSLDAIDADIRALSGDIAMALEGVLQ